MADRPQKVLICSCENSMPLDADALRLSCRRTTVETTNSLCRAETARVQNALKDGNRIVVGCTQEAPLFSELAGDIAPAPIFVNLRETAGWSKDGAAAAPKMAALIAAAAEPIPEVPLISLSSDGVVLIYGRDESAIEAGNLLADHLDVTVLITKPKDIAPPRVTEFPVVRGTIRQAKGYLGAFELVVDDYAAALPSSRGSLLFGTAKDGAISHCDLVLDLSGGAPLFPAADLRDGYLRADPRDPAAILRAVLKARDLVGTFDKPRYVNFNAQRCAHSRSRIVGCHRCLDLCPTGAIAPAGDHVAISAEICAGCGQCAAVCPTDAAAYALPPADALMRKLRILLLAYREASGRDAIVLFHDGEHGAEMIDALARYGDGLPANVLPLAVNEITQVGLDAVAGAIAYGASAVRFLTRAKPRHDVSGLFRMIALAEPILAGLGFGVGRVAVIETDDPDALGEALRAIELPLAAVGHATYLPVGRKGDITRDLLYELHKIAPAPVDIVPLPVGAPFGTLAVNVEGCTLCLSCVSACPTGALSDDPERPVLRFSEEACVQCGLCKATCPEKVIDLVPQYDFRRTMARTRTIKEEEPALCIRCNKPFGVKSSVDRVAAKLEGRHWMYTNAGKRLDAIRMCADCRVIAMSEEAFDPFNVPARPKPRTTEDYLRERQEQSKS
jgi:ferredoxin